VTLPSGKSVEVVYFEERLAEACAETELEPVGDQGLHICERCNSALVFPLQWDEASATEWEVTLRCPDCEWLSTGVYTQQAVESFDTNLDCGTRALVDDLQRLTVANMEDEIDRFSAALEADLLLPEDF
jgi:hypothetical protein